MERKIGEMKKKKIVRPPDGNGASFPQIEVYLASVYGSLRIHLSSNRRRNRSDVVPCDSEFWNRSKRPLNSHRTRATGKGGGGGRRRRRRGGEGRANVSDRGEERLAEKFTTTINFVHCVRGTGLYIYIYIYVFYIYIYKREEKKREREGNRRRRRRRRRKTKLS